MESNPDVPQELYGKWWQAVNTEFGEIIQDQEENQEKTSLPETIPESNTETSSANHSSATINQRSSNNHNQASTLRSELTIEEEENLADYLRLGMSLTEARETFQKEVEMAEIRLKIRESKRNLQRGTITTIGSSGLASRGNGNVRGRGGLSFN